MQQDEPKAQDAESENPPGEDALREEDVFGPEYFSEKDAEHPDTYYPLPEYDARYEYAGFQQRMAASLLDLLGFIFLLLMIMEPFQTVGDQQLLMQRTLAMRQEAQTIESFSDAWNSTLIRERLYETLTRDFIQISAYYAIILACWVRFHTTPGKLLLGVKVVDAQTGETPTNPQWVRRIIGYFIETLPIFLGFITILFSRKKQGFHDKLAGTVVLKDYSFYRRTWQWVKAGISQAWKKFRDRG